MHQENILSLINTIRENIKNSTDRSDSTRGLSKMLLEMAYNIVDGDEKTDDSGLTTLEQATFTSKGYENEIIHEKIYDNLRKECYNHRNIWRSSIYDSGFTDGTVELDQYTEAYDSYSIEPREITKEFLELNFCGMSPNLSPSFCSNCGHNFIKVKYFMDRNQLHLLADDWNHPYDEEDVQLNTIKNPQSELTFLANNPQCAELVVKSEKREMTDLIFKFDDYFNKFHNEILCCNLLLKKFMWELLIKY